MLLFIFAFSNLHEKYISKVMSKYMLSITIFGVRCLENLCDIMTLVCVCSI